MRPPKERIRNSDAIGIIAKYKKDNGLTSNQLGSAIGVTGDSLRTWISKNKPPTIKAWKLFCLYRDAKNGVIKTGLAPICSIHGKVCVKKCKPDKLKTEKKPTWKIMPPPCEVCNGKMVDVAEKKSRTHLWCDACKEFKKVEMQTITRYKY